METTSSFSRTKPYKTVTIFLVQAVFVLMTPLSILAQSRTRVTTISCQTTATFLPTGSTVKRSDGLSPWTSTGSSDLINQADLNNYAVIAAGGGIRVKGDLPQGSVHARYDITAVDGIYPGGSATPKVRHYWLIRYRDNSTPGSTASNGHAHVHLDLFQTNQNGKDTTLVQSFDSRDPCAPANSSNQTLNNDQTVVLFWNDSEFDFDTFTYWISATLDKNDATGDPRLINMKLLDCGSSGSSCSVVGPD